MAAARAARQAMDQQIDAVLRPDQKAKMDEIRAQMRARMQGGGGGGGPQ
jgi:Spy/CpxP family protein refolding chaperone